MRFLKKFFYVTVDAEGDSSEGIGSVEEEPNPFLTDFPEDDVDVAEDLPPDAQAIALDQSDLDFVDDVVAHTDFAAPSQGFETSEGEIDLNAILQGGGVDREAEEASGEYTTEKIWELLQEGVPQSSLPAIIKVSGKTVEAIVQDALRKGTICDEFEDRYCQEHQALAQSVTSEIGAVEQEIEAEIQHIKAETEMKIQELEERRQRVLEELRIKKQDSISKFERNIVILDTYEAQCAEVVKALKPTVSSDT